MQLNNKILLIYIIFIGFFGLTNFIYFYCISETCQYIGMFVDILYIFVKYVVLIVSLGLLFCRPKMLIYFSFSIVTIVIEELMKYNVVVHGEIKTYMLFGNLYTIPENQILSFIMIIQIIVLIIFRKRILSNKE